MKIIDLAPNIIYIEDAFPEYKEFIEAIESNNNNPDIHPVIPAWEDWYDGDPYRKENGSYLDWEDNPKKEPTGKQKLFDWDITISNNNTIWPKIKVGPYHSKAHSLAHPIIDLVDKRYLQALDVWAEKTGNKELEYVSKNYIVKKYNPGSMIAAHIDKNESNPTNTMDWTALIYLSDDYDGGELLFVDKDITIKPKAGSIIFFPCTELHEARPVRSGNKYFIFMMIHSEFGHTISLKEPYYDMNKAILKWRGIENHPLLSL